MSVHIEAKAGEIAEIVLLPGDPLRAKYIAETFLDNPVCYNQVRGMLGFTGTYKGVRVSVQGTGMGMPSASIYINELIQSYGVKTLIRVGTCGALSTDVHVRDLVIAQGAVTTSNMIKKNFAYFDFAPIADFHLMKAAYEVAVEKEMTVHVGNILSEDSFYKEAQQLFPDFGEFVTTSEGKGKVVGLNVLKNRVKIRFGEYSKDFELAEIEVNHG